MKSNLSAREINIYFIYLLLVLICSVWGISWLVFRNYNTNDVTTRSLVYRKAAQERIFLKKQKEALSLIDTAYKAIKIFNPALNAVYADNDIKNQLRNIKAYYGDNEGAVRYKIFAQTAAFYMMLLDDKKILQKKQSNVLLFKNQLQKCQIGFKESQNKMNLKAVLQQSADKNTPQ